MPEISRRASNITPSGKDGWEVYFAALSRVQKGEDIILLGAGDHDFDTPQETVEAAVRLVRAGHHHYTQLSGLPALRAAMAKVTQLSTGAPATAENAIATIGGQAALFAAAHATLDAGDHAIVVGPYYATYPGVFRAQNVGFTVVEAHAADGFQPHADEIAKAVRPNTKAILINSPNNPTGAVYSRATLQGIADLCIARDLWLISDEVYWTLTGETPHISPRGLPGMAERTLVVNSLSKSHGMTGWRIGWLAGPKDLIATLNSLNLVVTYGLPDFVSRAAIEALENRWGVDDIAGIYARRRAIAREALEGQNAIALRGSEGGMYAMIDVSEISADGERFAWDFLDAEKVCIMPGESFGEAAAGHVRVSLCASDDQLREAFSRLRRFVSSRIETGGVS